MYGMKQAFARQHGVPGAGSQLRREQCGKVGRDNVRGCNSDILFR